MQSMASKSCELCTLCLYFLALIAGLTTILAVSTWSRIKRLSGSSIPQRDTSFLYMKALEISLWAMAAGLTHFDDAAWQVVAGVALSLNSLNEVCSVTRYVLSSMPGPNHGKQVALR